MADERERKRYAFLLRCWQEADGWAGSWRFSLERVDGRSGDGRATPRHGFSSLADLLAHLQQTLGTEHIFMEDD